MHGFLALEDLSEEAQSLGRGRTSGNYGLLDQQAALQWVQVREAHIHMASFCHSHAHIHTPRPTHKTGARPRLWRRPRPRHDHRPVERRHQRAGPPRLPGLQGALPRASTLPCLTHIHNVVSDPFILYIHTHPNPARHLPLGVPQHHHGPPRRAPPEPTATNHARLR